MNHEGVVFDLGEENLLSKCLSKAKSMLSQNAVLRNAANVEYVSTHGASPPISGRHVPWKFWKDLDAPDVSLPRRTYIDWFKAVYNLGTSIGS